MIKPVDIAVAILNWNGKELLSRFLPSVVSFSKLPNVNTQVYVIDNNSSDDSVSFIEERYPETGIIKLDKNYGFAGGYNHGLKQIQAKYYVLLNSDVEVSENWLEPLYHNLEINPQVVACQPKIMSINSRMEFEYAGAAGGFIDKYGYSFCRGRIFNIFESDSGQYNQATEIFWATGACLFIKAEAFFTAGGLDDHFFAHMEEIDLCWRLLNRGHKIIYVPGSKVWHLGGATLKKSNPRKTYLNFRNNLYLLYKNLAPGKVFPIIFFRLLLDSIAAFKFLAGFEFKNFLAVIHAHYSFFTTWFHFRKSRKKNLAVNIKYDHPVIYHKSIVSGFFFKKIKYFSQLNFPVPIHDQDN